MFKSLYKNMFEKKICLSRFSKIPHALPPTENQIKPKFLACYSRPDMIRFQMLFSITIGHFYYTHPILRDVPCWFLQYFLGTSLLSLITCLKDSPTSTLSFVNIHSIFIILCTASVSHKAFPDHITG